MLVFPSPACAPEADGFIPAVHGKCGVGGGAAWAGGVEILVWSGVGVWALWSESAMPHPEISWGDDGVAITEDEQVLVSCDEVIDVAHLKRCQQRCHAPENVG